MSFITESNTYIEGETRWERFKRVSKACICDAKDWCVAHKEEVVLALPAVMMGTRQIAKTARAVFITNRRAKMMTRSVYDRSENHHWMLRRELTNAEWYEVHNRKKNGERLGDILASMKVLK